MSTHRILTLSAELAELEADIARMADSGEKVVPDYLHVIVRRRKQQLEDMTHAEAAHRDEVRALMRRDAETARPWYALLAVCAVVAAGYAWVLYGA